MHGCIKDDSGELLKHALKKKSAAFLSGAFLMELSPYISLSPIPHRVCLLIFVCFLMNANTTNNTLAYTYCADELVNTILCHTVHMCEMLLKVYVWELNLAQRALDSLRVERGKKSEKWASVSGILQETAGSFNLEQHLLGQLLHFIFM